MSARHDCPGEDNCTQFFMEPTCEGCPADPDLLPDLGPWSTHLFWLNNLQEAGCRFHLNDLTPDEWDGLIIVKQEQELAKGLANAAMQREMTEKSDVTDV